MLEKMNKVLSVDKESKQIKVQAQMTLKGFYETADAAHLSIPVEALPWWQGLTLGGVFATSSHGTGNNATHMIVSASLRASQLSNCARLVLHGNAHSTPAVAGLCCRCAQ
jgi:FAD/FMN-containing dehydrogenase